MLLVTVNSHKVKLIGTPKPGGPLRRQPKLDSVVSVCTVNGQTEYAFLWFNLLPNNFL